MTAEPLSEEELADIRRLTAAPVGFLSQRGVRYLDCLLATIDRDRERIAELEDALLRNTRDAVSDAYDATRQSWEDVVAEKDERIAELEKRLAAARANPVPDPEC